MSDGAFHGARADESGEALEDLLLRHGFIVLPRVVVPDEPEQVALAIRRLASEAALVVTTGGTGLGPRDITPEATLAVLERQAPGLAEAMRAAGARHTPNAMLSRGVAGTLGTSLVINLPGSPRGAVESLEAVLDVLPHALSLLAGDTAHGDAEAPAEETRDEPVEAPAEAAPDQPLEAPPVVVAEEPAEAGVPEPAGMTPGEAAALVAAEPGEETPAAGAVEAELLRRIERGEEVVLATAVQVHGAPPCQVGQKLLLGTGGPVAGTLGCAEFDTAATADAPGVLASRQPGVHTYRHDLGTVEVYLEPRRRGPLLVVLGATPVALWVLRWGRDLGYRTALVEPRRERVTAEMSRVAERVASHPGEVVLPGDEVDAVHTDHDAPLVAEHLATLVRAGAGFVGVMGSARHAAPHLKALRDMGFTDEEVGRVRSPVGLDVGARTPQGIALSILAGLAAGRAGRDGGWLDRKRG